MARNRGWHRNDIENPQAYQRAITASIHARANAKRFREWEAKHPHLAAWVNWNEPYMISHDGGVTYVENPAARPPLGPVPTFIRDALEKWGAPSEKATEVFQRIYDERTQRNADREAQRAAEAASALPWTAGRQVVEGVVISIKSYPGFTRWAGDTYKWLVKRDDGSRIFATIPSGADLGTYNELRGKRVRFTVTVEPKAEEPTFAFGSRPAKASIVTTEEG